MAFKSPFAASVASPGKGKAVLSILPPSIPTLTTLTYKYPLKLLSRTPGFTPEDSVAGKDATRPIHLYLLTYGGGLLPGDHIDVSITLEPRGRLVVTTPQGSTKIYKTPPEGRGLAKTAVLDDMSRQTLDVHIGSEAGLCYLVDPSAPFKDSRYEQIQVFTVDGSQTGNKRSSLCILDWVTQGRSSRGENWDFQIWKGRNEVWSEDKTTGKRRLLLRDSLLLDDETISPPQSLGARFQSSGLIRERTHPYGVFGTLILYGPMFDQLRSYFMEGFTSLPRIGGRNWSSTSTTAELSNIQDKVTWTSARVRAGFVLVKFGAKDVEAAREWLGDMIRKEGSIAREFGEEALTYDLPPTTIAKPLPVHKDKQQTKPAKKGDNRKAGKSKDATSKWADDTPRAFARLMRFQQLGKAPSGLDDGNDKPQNKKRKRGEDNDSSTKPNSKSTAASKLSEGMALKILPGEKLSDFAARVDQAMPLSAMKKSQRTGASENLPKVREERITKHERHLRKLQQGWREEEARISAKEAEERELREAENDELEEMWREAQAEAGILTKKKKKKTQSKKKKKGKKRAGDDGDEVEDDDDDDDDDPWAKLNARERAAKPINPLEVVQAPPESLAKPREIFRVRRGVGGAEVDVANIPAAAGSLRRREALAEERKSIVEEYRRLMAAKRGQ
ncbi:urease accessory protein UreD [Talaromyces stipitatus ATCC 10500]|uniref:Urease accessory protein UreD n=1 Tax=Talaromyces stipitatus (strain ATCC 10500 / CBS 375.48 / QM 6759 / NRRL 1006) TaxID=441959 RepID=B8MQ06_TALSN|nr:urease accessory protein UreD [Talaromyces stipitatus ATCC 10500]EED12896.1 urease accessory protein UreD [Talaromyces stipitatus ATCC 10500]